MRVTIHQPEHLPWLGFFHKLCRADIVVILDNVQFSKNYFQNRNRIIGSAGPMWLAVPVLTKGHTSKKLNEMEILPQTTWKKKYIRTLEQVYGRHPHFSFLSEGLLPIFWKEWRFLVDLNMAVIEWFLNWLDFRKPVHMASTLDVSGAKSELLLEICRAVNATSYLSGPSGRDYLEERLFQKSGISVDYHDFEHPVYYQKGQEDFVSHLSTVDLIANLGDEGRKFLIQREDRATL